MTWHDEINWFAVRTKRFGESLAVRSVAALEIESFLPMIWVDRSEQPAIRIDRKPLFPGYFFARFIPGLSLKSVESCYGVFHVVRSDVFPVPVDVEIIEEIRQRVHSDGLIRLKKPSLRPGDRVSIQSGVFEGMFGRVEVELDDQKRVAILLETMWNARVVVARRWVEPQPA